MPDAVVLGIGCLLSKEAKLFKPEGDAVIEVGKDGKSLGRDPSYMPTDKLAEFVAELLKAGDVSPAVPWNGSGGRPFRAASDIPPFRAPRLDKAIQKEGAFNTPAGQLEKAQRIGAPKVSAPPGPSIAEISKPKGARFGIGIPGAFKTKI